jgi:hypothetical protein
MVASFKSRTIVSIRFEFILALSDLGLPFALRSFGPHATEVFMQVSMHADI